MIPWSHVYVRVSLWTFLLLQLLKLSPVIIFCLVGQSAVMWKLEQKKNKIYFIRKFKRSCIKLEIQVFWQIVKKNLPLLALASYCIWRKGTDFYYINTEWCRLPEPDVDIRSINRATGYPDAFAEMLLFGKELISC